MGLFDSEQEPIPHFNTGKTYRKSPETIAKESAFEILHKEGVPAIKAAKIVGIGANKAYQLTKQCNAYDLARDRLLSDSVKTLKKFVKGEAVGVLKDDQGNPIKGTGVTPKCSTVIRAAEMVLDREAPKVALSASITADFSPVDLTDYQ